MHSPTTTANSPEAEDSTLPTTSQTGHPRTEARLAAVQTLFAARSMGEDVAETAADLLPNAKQRKADAALYANIVAEAGESSNRYAAMLAAHMTDEWPLERIDPVHYAILWAAAAELACMPETPVKVIINEYLNIAKGFESQPPEVGFINAVLDKLAAKLRQTA
jgi:N utilization substance protein B